MKHDYLWDKTGSDPDIERLEELLSGFRYKGEAETASNVIEFPSRPGRSMRPWIFAMAACVAISAISVGFWITRSGSGEMPGAPVGGVTQDIVSSPILETAASAVSDASEIAGSAPKYARAAKKPRSSMPRKATVALKRPRPDNTILTREERYAYNQLILALTIASSKLQVVRDSVNGLEENDTNNK